MSEDKPDPGKAPEKQGQAQPAKAAADPAAAKKKVDTKPFVRPSAPYALTRRDVFPWLWIGWAAFIGVLVSSAALFGRFLFPNVLFEPKQSFLAGFPDEYVVGAVSERYKASQAVWIVRDTQKIFALSTVCTHLGCTPNWLENESKFKCPCHGSGFYKTGINFEGPAPRPLERFRIALTDTGEILVDKTKKFQQEKGEWTSAESFLVV